MRRACVLAARSMLVLARPRVRVSDAHPSEELGLEQDDVERSPQLVRERREEEVLGSIGALCLEPGLPLGLEELGALALERPDAGDVVDGDQRHRRAPSPDDGPARQGEDLAADSGELDDHLETGERGALGRRVRDPTADVEPLPRAPDAQKADALDIAHGEPEEPVKCVVGRYDLQVGVDHDQRGRDRLDDALCIVPRGLGVLHGALEPVDVDERENGPVEPPVGRLVGPDLHAIPPAFRSLDVPLPRDQIVDDAEDSLGHVFHLDLEPQVIDGATHVLGDEGRDLVHRRSEPSDPERHVDDHHRDIDAREHVLEIAGDLVELVVAVPELFVEGAELFGLRTARS